MYPLAYDSETPAIPLTPLNKPALAQFRESAVERVRRQLDLASFSGEFGQIALIQDGDGVLTQALVGVDGAPSDPRQCVHLFAKLGDQLPAGHAFAIEGEWPGFDAAQAAIGWGLAGYKFTKYLKKEPKPKSRLIVPESVSLEEVKDLLDGIWLARDLINTPANDLGPADLCEQAKDVAHVHGAQIRIVSGEALLEENYPAVYAVGKGSPRSPALIDMRWGDESHPKLTLIGKGVVFDTGGLNLKPTSGMGLMKKDMGGAAVTLSLAQTIMARKLPVRLRLMIPTVENSPGLHAYRPSDVIKTRKGISVEIGNTDAEGRVIMCDAIAEAVEENPDLLIDMATLTGACRVALGQDLPGFWTADDAIARGLEDAAREVADPVWRMPLWLPYRRNLKSPIADINNMANTGMGGAITAALYLHEFVKPFERWLHFDMYGWRTETIPGHPKGGEATALRALFAFLKQRYGAE